MGTYISDQIATMSAGDKLHFAIKKNNTVLMYGDDVLDYIQYTYEYWKTAAPLVDLWDIYEATHHDDFIKAWDAWNADYNPLHNYDGEEISLDVKNEGNTTMTNTPDSTRNKITTRATADAKTVTENAVTTYDDTTPRLDNKSTETPTGGTETTYDYKTTAENSRGNTSMTVDGETVSGHDISYHKLTKGGNLGVTTSQQMIESEIEMRLRPLLKMYLDTFVKEYAYCCE